MNHTDDATSYQQPTPVFKFQRYESLLTGFKNKADCDCHRCVELGREQAALKLRWRF